MKPYAIVIAACISCLLLPAHADQLTSQIDAILDAPALASGCQGVEIETVKGSRVLYGRNGQRVFLPASNNKLLTSSAALGLLGPDFQYKTVVKSAGEISNGTLHGDLVIVGSGDPTLLTLDLHTIAADIKKAGVTHIDGRVLYDASVFDEQWLGESWTWDNEPYAYSAEIAGLNVDRNVMSVVISPGIKSGDPIKVTLPPGADSCVTVENTATTGGDRPRVRVSRKRGTNTITVTGMCPALTQQLVTAEVTIENPALYTACLFAAALKQEGVTVSDPHGAKLDKPLEDAKELATHSSPKLADILTMMLKPSDNMIAEGMLKTVGAVKRKVGTAGYSGTGASIARDWFLSVGLEQNQLHQVDGSGLSRQDYVSPENLVKLLRYWTASPQYDAIYSALPIAGVDGTLRNRMKGTSAEKNCHAKTGSLGQVSCLSGYVTSKDGVPLVFSIMMNNQLGPMSACTGAENQIVELLAASTIGADASSAAAPK